MAKKIIIFLLLLLIAVGERLWFDLGPNVELIMTGAVLASMYLGRSWGVALALLALAISDLVIGNTMIMVFTWSAFGLIGFGGRWINKRRGSRRAIVAGGYGLVSALGFYFYSNFGVWLITSMYEKSIRGLILCYEMALPFLRVHAVSSVLFVGGGVGLVELVRLLISLKSSGTRWKFGTVPQL